MTSVEGTAAHGRAPHSSTRRPIAGRQQRNAPDGARAASSICGASLGRRYAGRARAEGRRRRRSERHSSRHCSPLPRACPGRGGVPTGSPPRKTDSVASASAAAESSRALPPARSTSLRCGAPAGGVVACAGVASTLPAADLAGAIPDALAFLTAAAAASVAVAAAAAAVAGASCAPGVRSARGAC